MLLFQLTQSDTRDTYCYFAPGYFHENYWNQYYWACVKGDYWDTETEVTNETWSEVSEVTSESWSDV